MPAESEILQPSQRKYLKGLAHTLKPVVQLGGGGLTQNVLEEIQMNLHAHELIKIQLPPALDASEKTAFTEDLRSRLRNEVQIVSRIGRMVILFYKKDPEEAKIKLPRAKKSQQV